MLFNKEEWNHLSIVAQIASFPAKNGTEYHTVFEQTAYDTKVEIQFSNIKTAIVDYLNGTKNRNGVFCRFFISDAVNQKVLFADWDLPFAYSIVQQPPLNGSKISAWLYSIDNTEVVVSEDKKSALFRRGKLTHHLNTQMQSPMQDEARETAYIFDNYINYLNENSCSLAQNCIRTWIYVQGVDIHYAKMVSKRKQIFEEANLTPATHFIASTGIEGRHFSPQSLVLMDGYAIEGIEEQQISYLKGASHLNPTCEYGVTFERATEVAYGDRKHIFVSGTASIDNRGDVVHIGKIRPQLHRTLENIEVLLSEGNATMKDIAQMIVYLRDTADYQSVKEELDARHNDIPKVYVWAPVCRPEWLIEIECIAIKKEKNSQFIHF